MILLFTIIMVHIIFYIGLIFYVFNGNKYKYINDKIYKIPYEKLGGKTNIKQHSCSWSCEDFSYGCPFCGKDSYAEGPQGGVCINTQCCECGAKFNFMGPMGVELLEGPTNNKYKNGAVV